MRHDLADPGLFTPDRTKDKSPRKPPILLGIEGEVVPEPERTFIGYDARGGFTADEVASAAKQVILDGVEKFFIKMTPTGHMFDPVGPYSRTDDLARIERSTGRQAYTFRQVPKGAFDNYIRYLKRGVAIYLRDAERTVSDG